MRAYDAIQIRFPDQGDQLDQDEEWCEVGLNGERRRIRLHDYDEMFSIPGLYERLIYDELQCDSPRVVCSLLAEQVEASGEAPEELRVLDLGAGNGIVGEELERIGADEIVGVDILEGAAEATARDRPGVYDDYKVLDLTEMDPPVERELDERDFNCLTSVAALGFGDMPPDALAAAYNLIDPGGWVAFSIKEDFINGADQSGFAELVAKGIDDGSLELCRQERYRHRLSVAGEPLHYVAVVARKRDDLS